MSCCSTILEVVPICIQDIQQGGRRDNTQVKGVNNCNVSSKRGGGYEKMYQFTFSTAFRFGFERSAYTILEGDGQMHFCITANHGDGSEVYTVTIMSRSYLHYLTC